MNKYELAARSLMTVEDAEMVLNRLHGSVFVPQTAMDLSLMGLTPQEIIDAFDNGTALYLLALAGWRNTTLFDSNNLLPPSA